MEERERERRGKRSLLDLIWWIEIIMWVWVKKELVYYT